LSLRFRWAAGTGQHGQRNAQCPGTRAAGGGLWRRARREISSRRASLVLEWPRPEWPRLRSGDQAAASCSASAVVALAGRAPAVPGALKAAGELGQPGLRGSSGATSAGTRGECGRGPPATAAAIPAARSPPSKRSESPRATGPAAAAWRASRAKVASRGPRRLRLPGYVALRHQADAPARSSCSRPHTSPTQTARMNPHTITWPTHDAWSRTAPRSQRAC
jgi:hypothetical protein